MKIPKFFDLSIVVWSERQDARNFLQKPSRVFFSTNAAILMAGWRRVREEEREREMEKERGTEEEREREMERVVVIVFRNYFITKSVEEKTSSKTTTF